VTLHFHDAAGIVGSMLIVTTYLLLQLRRINIDEARYSILNALGAGLIIFSLSMDFNLSAFIIEAFWLAISLIGIIQNFKLLVVVSRLCSCRHHRITDARDWRCISGIY
jgi:hypothetical protein